MSSRLSIYDIKYRIPEDVSSKFFDRATMRFFKQTLKDFRVTKASVDGYYHVRAPMPGKLETYRLYDDISRRFVPRITSFEEAEKYLKELSL